MHLGTGLLDHPVRNLIALSIGWKLLLLFIAAGSPGPGYDTSSSLLSSSYNEGRALPPVLRYIVGRLTRWDAIYFVQVANRGYMFEQEWAFGWGFTRAVALCVAGLQKVGVPHYEGLEGLIAVCIAHVSHLLSVLVLFKLTSAVFPRSPPSFAFTAAALHIISPAGMFLSAPYAESSCAFLTFAGCLLFTKGLGRPGQSTASHDILILASGILFGIATTFRSNGILNGLLLLEEALRTLFQLKNGCNITTIRRLVATGIGGMSVGVGFLLPQYIAYIVYCTDPSTVPRPWCGRALPSIYSFVQDYYWNVGLFRYWTLSNLPLFLLSAPMFVVLAVSGLWALRFDTNQRPAAPNDVTPKGKNEKTLGVGAFPIIRNLAASQLLLALLTLTTAHVQIITRISSSYSVWIWYIAMSGRQGNRLIFGNLVRFMVIYAVVQGGLFASFLPPA